IKLKARVKKLERLNKVKSSNLKRLKKVGTSQRIESSEDVENVFNQGRMNVDMETNEGVELVAAASTPIPAAKPKILKIATAAPAASIRRRKGVVIRDPEEELHEHEEAYKQIDWNVAFDHVRAKETQYIKRYHGFKKKPQSESEARKNMISYLKNTKGFKMEFFKGKTYDQILPIFQARKLSEEVQEADNLKGHLEIVPEEDDDVFVEAVPLAQKAPVVDYQVVVVDNRPKYKIIRADDTHQFYISFTILLKNFDREDLKAL
nr:hypothetical protein [Tanacetum cinerariifolium]